MQLNASPALAKRMAAIMGVSAGDEDGDAEADSGGEAEGGNDEEGGSKGEGEGEGREGE